MFKNARNRAGKIAGNRLQLLLRVSFLITFGLWSWGLHTPKDGVIDVIITEILAVIASAFTFEWVALGLLLLLVPVHIFLSLFSGKKG